MILQALNEYYNKLLDDPESGIAPPGFSVVDVSFVLLLSKDGELLDMIRVETTELVPEHKKRQGINPPPYFLCDKILYFLGIGEDGNEGLKRFEEYKKFNISILSQLDCIEAKIVCKFLDSWQPQNWLNIMCLAKYKEEFEKSGNYNVVYRIEGIKGFVHKNDEISEAWLKYSSQSQNTYSTQCLITGKENTIAKIHSVPIKGVLGCNTAGAAIVSFNKASFESYGKEQSFNAPVSEKAAFAYSTALNYLLSSDTNKVRFADTTMVFWTEKETFKSRENEILTWAFNPFDVDKRNNGEKEEKEYRIDPASARQAKEILEKISMGLPIKNAEFNPEVKCYILGLAPNAARISVRFWEVNTFGGILNRVAMHYSDISIEGIEHGGKFIPAWRLLKEIAVRGESKNIPPLLGGQLMKSIIKGQLYPQCLYIAALSRTRHAKRDDNDRPVNAISVGIIKACLVRKYRILGQKDKEEMITMGLNESLTNQAYRLGRLFSLLEKAQKDALGGGINSSISDKYFGSASATPLSVFPLLLRLYRHHKSKLQKEGKGTYIDIKIQEVMNGLESFPAHLNLEEQGLFVLGYYHQNQSNYTKKEDKEEN